MCVLICVLGVYFCLCVYIVVCFFVLIIGEGVNGNCLDEVVNFDGFEE